MTAPEYRPAMTPLQQQLAVVQFDLANARNRRQDQLDIAQRRTYRLASVLGMAAAALALYDLTLLARMGHG